MSNWYVRRNRERFWAGKMSDDKVAAYMTLYTALVTIAKAAAPIVPFMTEEIYQNLVAGHVEGAPESVHLCSYPVSDPTLIDPALEADMDNVLEIVTLGRAARNSAERKNRQPLAEVFVQSERKLDELYQAVVCDELNIKKFTYVEDASRFVTYTFKPQLKLLGQKYGKRIGEIRQKLAGLDGTAAKKQLDQTGALTLSLSDGDISLTPEELLIDTYPLEGYETQSDRGVSVTLDIRLTDALIEEGFVRELVGKKSQSMRKEAGFEVMDRITVYCEGNERIAGLMRSNEQSILHDVMGAELRIGETDGFTQQWDVNGEKVTLGVKKIEG